MSNQQTSSFLPLLNKSLLNRKLIVDDKMSIWEEVPVLFDQFIDDPNHVKFPTLSPAQMNACWNPLYGEPYENYLENPHKDKINRNVFENTQYPLSILEVGKGGGKDTIIELIAQYLIYNLLCMENPQKVFNMAEDSDIDIINIATTGKQAKIIFFNGIKKRLMKWRWLHKYPIRVSNKPFSVGDKSKNRANTVIINADYVEFPKSIRLFSGNSERESAEGLSPIACFLDELSGFRNSSDKPNADNMFNMLDSSARTRFGDKAKIFAFSFPRYKDDAIETLYKKSLTDPHIYGDKQYSWNFKPRNLFPAKTFKFEGIDVPWSFKAHVERDPTDFKCKILCMPPDAESPFMEYPERLDACIDLDKPELIEFENLYNVDKQGKKYVKLKIKKVSPGVFRHQIILTLDLAENSCEAGFSGCHREGNKLIRDFTTSWVPQQGYIVDFENVEDIILEVNERFSVYGVYADRFQSTMMLQRLQKSMRAEKCSLYYQDYKHFLDMLYTANVNLGNHPKLIKQIKSLQRIENTKVSVGTEKKDLLDTIVTACKILFPDDGKNDIGSPEEEGTFISDNLVSSSGGSYIRGSF